MTDGLFDLPVDYTPPAPVEKPGRGERRRRLIAARILAGKHPLGYVPLHPDAPRRRGDEGPTCGDCRFRVVIEYPKCRLPVTRGEETFHPRATGCEASDIRRWWPAGRDYQPTESDEL